MNKFYYPILIIIFSFFFIQNNIAQSVLSLQSFGDNGYDAGQEMVLDEDANSVRAGLFSGKIYFANDSIDAGVNGAGYIAKYNSNDLAQWAINLDGVSTVDIKLDVYDNIYFATRKIGTGAIPLDLGVSCMVPAYNGFYIAKLNGSGNCQWVFGPEFGNAEVHAIDIDTFGNVYVTGEVYNGTTIGGTTIATNGGTDVFVMKLNANGTMAYIVNYGGTGDDVGRDIWVDNNEKIYVTGDIRNCLDFGGVSTTFNGINDFLLAGLNATNGTVDWVYNNGSADYSYGFSLEGDHLGNLFITGAYTFAPIFGNSDFDENNRFLLAKFTDSGSLTWSKMVDANSSWTQPHNQGAATQWMGNKLLLDVDANELYLTVRSSGQANFGNTTLNNASQGIYVVKYDLDGEVTWAQQSEGGDNQCNGLGKTANGNIRLYGTFDSDMTMEDITINTANSNADIFLAELYDAAPSVGISNNKEEHVISLYPNPIDEQFYISIENTEMNFQVEIYSILGIKTFEKNFNNSIASINTKNWDKGVYIVKTLTADNKLLKTKKIIIR